MNTIIKSVTGRRVWDSRGRPTVETEITLEGGTTGRAIAPAGASTGSAEAVDLRDGGPAFGGYDVQGALSAVNGEIAGLLVGCEVTDQTGLDTALIELDGTRNKHRLGGNAIVATSMAIAHAAAASQSLALWRYLGTGREDFHLPLPEVQIFGGGAHAGRRVDVQDFMVIAVGATDYAQSLEWAAEVYRAAGQLMNEAGLLQGVADEGGYWPAFDSNEQALEFLLRAIERAGYTPGQDVAISLDIAATDFGRNREYTLARDRRRVDSDALSEMLLGWLARYPIVAIEDPLAEDDAEGLRKFTAAAGPGIQVVADDFICTDAARIRSAAECGACNTALIKPNQAGTLTEARTAFDAACAAGWGSIVSARSGESEDVTIVHLAVGWGAKQLKVGSFSRSERMAKWNEGLRLAEALGQAGGRLAPRESFPWGRP
ncbi:MAG: phosphopyruvate hydratase [Rhodocyclaceae bacterium]|nr:MAG: phosphopyruvate hydratase [Rhodocyclaceae bacterium]